jgi:2-polyprenyl-3-methyl-5-hydroxy-6-metoxy-1,4-benzoquinol methylase
MKPSYERLSCRFCGNSDLVTVLDLGSSPLCDEYRSEKSVNHYFPLRLNLCSDCASVQTSEVVDAIFIYSNYVYFTHTSPGLDDHFKRYSAVVGSIFDEPRGLVVDVGSNDGCLLSHFSAQGFQVLGIEPSSSACDYALKKRGIHSINGYFNRSSVDVILSQYGKARVITFNNVFANIDDLESLISLAAELLSADGVMIIESSYLFDMVDNMVFDFIYHEHLSYLSLRPLQALLSRFNLKVFDVQRIATKGGSVRYFVAHRNSQFVESLAVREMESFEAKKGSLVELFTNFKRRVFDSKSQFLYIMDKLSSRGRVFGFGASATSTTLLHAWGVGDRFQGLIDDNPYKHHTYSPGYGLTVYPFTDNLLDTDDTVVILAWRFQDAILQKLKDFKGNIIVPLPTPTILQRHSGIN